MGERQLVRVVAPHFVAGFEVDTETGFVVRAAPILYHACHGRSVAFLREDLKRRGWVASIVRCRTSPGRP